MAISSLGVGSGLALSSILSSLMQVEQQPLVALQTKEASYQARISALGTLKSNLSSLKSATTPLFPTGTQTASEKFSSLKASMGDSTVATATAKTGAIQASYTLTDVTLANAEKIRKSGDDITIPAAGNDGTLSIAIGTGTAVDVEVSGGATLQEIAEAINAQATTVTAAIVNDGSADHLVISSKSTGATNTLSITGSAGWEDFSYTNTTAVNGWTQQQEPTSASVKINGLLVNSETNTISTAISNVTINLLKESAAGTSLTVTKDTNTALSTALNAFVKAYNTAAGAMKELGAYDAETKTAGALQGDSTLRGAQYQLRNLLATKGDSTSDYQTLSDLGIAVQKDGTLALNSTKLNAAIEADFDGVANLVAKVGKAFDSALDGMVGNNGNIAAATNSAKSIIEDLQDRETAFQERLVKIQERYQKQFSALDSLVSSMNQTSTYLTQQLANLSNLTNN